MLGLTMEEACSLSTEVWDCNWPSVLVFESVATQWRMGMDGPTGLDYAAIPAVFRLRDVPRKQWQGMFDDIRVMEDAALKFFAYQRSQRR